MDRICEYVAVGRTKKRLALRTLNSFINLLLIYNSFMILTRRGEGGGCLKQLLKASTCAALFPSYSFFSCTLYVPPPPHAIVFYFVIFQVSIFFRILVYLTNVSAIETEGVTDESTNAWVESCYVIISNDSQPGSFVNYIEKGVISIVTYTVK